MKNQFESAGMRVWYVEHFSLAFHSMLAEDNIHPGPDSSGDRAVPS